MFEFALSLQLRMHSESLCCCCYY